MFSELSTVHSIDHQSCSKDFVLSLIITVLIVIISLIFVLMVYVLIFVFISILAFVLISVLNSVLIFVLTIVLIFISYITYIKLILCEILLCLHRQVSSGSSSTLDGLESRKCLKGFDLFLEPYHLNII